MVVGVKQKDKVSDKTSIFSRIGTTVSDRAHRALLGLKAFRLWLIKKELEYVYDHFNNPLFPNRRLLDMVKAHNRLVRAMKRHGDVLGAHAYLNLSKECRRLLIDTRAIITAVGGDRLAAIRAKRVNPTQERLLAPIFKFFEYACYGLAAGSFAPVFDAAIKGMGDHDLLIMGGGLTLLSLFASVVARLQHVDSSLNYHLNVFDKLKRRILLLKK